MDKQEEVEFINAVIEYEKTCNELEALINSCCGARYSGMTLKEVAQLAQKDLQEAKWLIEDAKALINEHHIADDSRLKKLIERL